MKVYFAVLAALFVIPIAGLGGYSLKPDPALPSFADYVSETQNVKHVLVLDTDDWVAVAVSGPNKGGSVPVLQALSFYRTHADLEAAAGGKVSYFERKCVFYTSSGKKTVASDPVLVQRCTQTVKTRKQAEEYMLTALAPTPKA
jgi:hypothetical protein